jgi:putative membrane protein
VTTQDEKEYDDPRVALAGERTLLAYVRTGIALMGFGFIVARFGLFLRELAAANRLESPPATNVWVWVGALMVLFGVVVNGVAAVQQVLFLRRLRRRQPAQPAPLSLGVIVAALLTGLGAGILATLVIMGH